MPLLIVKFSRQIESADALQGECLEQGKLRELSFAFLYISTRSILLPMCRRWFSFCVIFESISNTSQEDIEARNTCKKQ